MLNVIGSVAQFEREMMLERQREGIAKAKLEGKYKGRKATARAKSEMVRELHERGLGPSDIARQVGIGRASVYRILEDPFTSSTTQRIRALRTGANSYPEL